MNKSDLVSRLADRLGGDRKTASAAVDGVLEEIEQSLARGERVSLTGFGTFDRRERAPRVGRNPATGQTIQIGASVAPVFRAGTSLKQVLTQASGTAAGIALTPAPPAASTAEADPVPVADVVALPETPTKAPKPAKTAKSSKSGKAAKADSGKAGKKTSGKGGKKK